MRRLLPASVAILVVMAGLAVPAAAAAPTVSSFTPTSGPLRTSVKITGSNFVAPVTVKFNGTVATSVVVNSSTQLTAQVPGSANSGPISVTSGGSTATSSASFTVTPGVYVPVTAGPPGTKVSVYFSGFAAYEAVDVYFDSTDLKLVSASGTGSGVTTPIVPATAGPGEHFFTVVGRKSGNSAQGTFTVRADWSQFGGGPAHENQNAVESTLGPGNVKKLTPSWTKPAALSSDNVSSYEVQVVGGVVYAATDTGLLASSAATGGTLWTRDVGAVLASPAVVGSTVVVATYTGHLIGLNASTGSVRYDITYGNQYFYKPIVVVGTVGYTEVDIAGADGAAVIAFDVATGAQRWNFTFANQCLGTSAAGGLVYVTCGNGHLYALRGTNGSLVFDRDLSEFSYQGTPAVTNGLVITAGYKSATSQYVVVAADAATGETMWSRPLGFEPGVYASPAVADDAVIVRGASGGSYPMAAFAVADGTPLWTVASAPNSGFPLTTANGLLYAPDAKSTTVFDAATGARVTSIRGGQFAVVVDGGVYSSVGGSSLSRYSAPVVTQAARRPDADELRPNLALR